MYCAFSIDGWMLAIHRFSMSVSSGLVLWHVSSLLSLLLVKLAKTLCLKCGDLPIRPDTVSASYLFSATDFLRVCLYLCIRLCCPSISSRCWVRILSHSAIWLCNCSCSLCSYWYFCLNCHVCLTSCLRILISDLSFSMFALCKLRDSLRVSCEWPWTFSKDF